MGGRHLIPTVPWIFSAATAPTGDGCLWAPAWSVAPGDHGPRHPIREVSERPLSTGGGGQGPTRLCSLCGGAGPPPGCSLSHGGASATRRQQTSAQTLALLRPPPSPVPASLAAVLLGAPGPLRAGEGLVSGENPPGPTCHVPGGWAGRGDFSLRGDVGRTAARCWGLWSMRTQARVQPAPPLSRLRGRNPWPTRVRDTWATGTARARPHPRERGSRTPALASRGHVHVKTGPTSPRWTLRRLTLC